MSATLEKRSPCKVNLILNILGRRADGFHELETILQPIDLCDHLRFDRGGAAGGAIALTCSDAALPTDSSNLVHRAASSFLQRTAIRESVSIHLEKRIPMAAGLGGGSGNAAVTLLALNELFGLPLAAAQLHEIAASLGSDVPFFLQSQPALATGRGELITPLAPFPALRQRAVLLIHPGFGVATAWAYKELAQHPNSLNGQPGRAQRLVELLQTPDTRRAGAGFYNSLEAPVLAKHPILELYQEFLRAEGALAALMSGSGSTTFALAQDTAQAECLQERVRAKFGRCWTAVVAFPA
jgi:4-diphosphocytidyl-2-C-methyl-D-erythritol kinase